MGAGASTGGKKKSLRPRVESIKKPQVGGDTWKVFTNPKKVVRHQGRKGKKFGLEYAFWRIETSKRVVILTLEHDLVWGHRKIYVNGLLGYNSGFKFKLTGDIRFTLDGAGCVLNMSVKYTDEKGFSGGCIWSYELYVQGKHHERLERMKTLSIWNAGEGENMIEIQFDTETMLVYANRDLIDTTEDFATVGSVYRFKFKGHSFELFLRPKLESTNGSMMETELKMDGNTIKRLPTNYFENLAKILENVANKKFNQKSISAATSKTEKDMLDEFESNVRKMRNLKRLDLNLCSTSPVKGDDENDDDDDDDDTNKNSSSKVDEKEEDKTSFELSSFEKQMFAASAAASREAETKALNGVNSEDYEKRMIKTLEEKRKRAASMGGGDNKDEHVLRAFSREASASKLGNEEEEVISKNLPDGTALRVFSRDAPPSDMESKTTKGPTKKSSENRKKLL